jgi:cytoplasmic iron level regulating protein YaaA (DUF328/UPF0246 family)
MNLQNNTGFSELSNILDNQLINSFKPHVDAIHNVQSKGIYFWFMKQKAYSSLSQYETISPIEPRYTKTINGEIYDLVYLGTAGTGKKGNSNLKNRFDWHINQNHKDSYVCNGTLSTLRAGLGALLAEDLILPNTEELVNTFMKNSMILFWVEYPNNNELIDSDEKILINIIKPLLNLKSNSNARLTSLDNSTKSYKRRRALVYKNTRLRLSCKGESEKSMKTLKTPTLKTPNYDDQILDVNNNCFEYYVSNGQFIDEVTRGIDNLPTHKAKIKIWDSNNTDNVFNEWQFRSTGDELKPDAQNIYTYFSNTHKNIKRADIIMNWMNTNQIEEITVKVCSNGITTESSNITINKKSSKSKKTNKKDNSTFNQTNEFTKLLNSLNLDKLKTENGPKLLIIGCSNSKSTQPNSLDNDNHENYNFGNAINSYREIRENYYINELPIGYFNSQVRNGNNVDRQYFMNALNNNPQKALDLYGSNQSPFYNPQIKGLYRLKIETSNLHLLIISGLYGLVKHSDYINDYHLEIYKGRNIWVNSITNAINQYINDNQIDHNLVFYSLSDKYLNKINPNTQWKNLWISHDRGQTSAKFLKEYFLPNL